jgi:hypothetical protein
VSAEREAVVFDVGSKVVVPGMAFGEIVGMPTVEGRQMVEIRTPEGFAFVVPMDGLVFAPAPEDVELLCSKLRQPSPLEPDLPYDDRLRMYYTAEAQGDVAMMMALLTELWDSKRRPNFYDRNLEKKLVDRVVAMLAWASGRETDALVAELKAARGSQR